MQFQPKYKRLPASDGGSDAPVQFQTAQAGQYRIQNLSAAGFLMYVGVNIPPDFTQPAAGFSASLPLTVPTPLPGSGLETLFVVPRYRDSYGCISQNSNPTLILLTPTGPVLAPIQPPLNVVALPQANGNIKVIGNYPNLGFDENPANQVIVWVGTSPPNTNVSPTYQGNINTTPFVAAFGSYTQGLYYVAVSLYRSADGYTTPPVLVTCTFPAIPPSLSAVFTSNVTDP